MELLTERLIAPLVLATMGGLAAVLHKGRERKLRSVVGSIFTSMFAGVLTYLIVHNFNVPAGLKLASVGIAGYSSDRLLPVAEEWAKNHRPGINDDTSKTSEGDDEC